MSYKPIGLKAIQAFRKPLSELPELPKSPELPGRISHAMPYGLQAAMRNEDTEEAFRLREEFVKLFPDIETKLEEIRQACYAKMALRSVIPAKPKRPRRKP